jgi:exportin-T
MFDVLDELIGPLNAHVLSFLSQAVTGTDDGVVHEDTKRAYIALLNGIMTCKLQDIFISGRKCYDMPRDRYIIQPMLLGNKGTFESLLENMLRLAADVTDVTSQKAAFVFLRHGVNVWGQPLDNAPSTPSNGTSEETRSEGLPGFERFIYERLVPTAFRVPSLPELNLKDGQVVVVSTTLLFCPRVQLHVGKFFAGAARDRQLASSNLQSPGRRSIQLSPFRLSPRSRLAKRDRSGIHDEAGRWRW